MPDFSFSVGELTAQIKREGKMNIAHLGNDNDQNTFIWYYITEAMWANAGLIRKKRVTEPLVVSSAGYVDFTIGGNVIEDLYAPLFIYIDEEGGRTYTKRTSFENPKGWWRETANDKIHIRDPGTYVMQYIAYPQKAITANQALDIPQSAYGLLKYKAISLIKESLNDLEGAKQADEMAMSKTENLEAANKHAMGVPR